ncbi:MAG TPA: ABC transporter ATP-binding protein [Symbiobacteriaceae bacterium]|nr:ABC transporter ATP-binding protein [Symbiobacteriaceae bacterium]
MEPAIRLSAVTKLIDGRPAVQGIDLTVYPGEMLGLVGPDGAGKTTLTRLAAGALAPTSGTVEPESRGRVGYLSGRFSLYPELTVWENLRFFAELYQMKGPAIKAAGEQLLESLGLLAFRARRAGALSGGMRQKLALACAVVHQPPILILDEPTTAVDPVARNDFWTLLREQAKAGRAVLMTTPYFNEAAGCDRVALLHEGRILAVDTPAALRERLPVQMALLAPLAGQRRGDVMAAAESLPGVVWTFPVGLGVRVALGSSGATAPEGYELLPQEPTLEDLFIWLTRQEVAV